MPGRRMEEQVAELIAAEVVNHAIEAGLVPADLPKWMIGLAPRVAIAVVGLLRQGQQIVVEKQPMTWCNARGHSNHCPGITTESQHMRLDRGIYMALLEEEA